MKQADLGLNLSAKRTRKRRFLDEMNAVVPWADLVALIAPYAPEAGRRGRQPFAVEVMLRIHFMQQWFTLSDPAMEEALHDVPLYREFAGLDNWHTRLPDESTILRFRHLLEQHKLAEQMFKLINELLIAKGLLLKAGTAVDATLIAAPSSTKNKDKARDPEMHSSQKGNNWHFGMKAHIGVDADSGLTHCVRGTAGNVHDIVQANTLLHGDVTDAFGDSARSGAGNLDSLLGGNSGHNAGPKGAGHRSFDGQEISAAHPPHPHAGFQGAGRLGGLARRQDVGRSGQAV